MAPFRILQLITRADWGGAQRHVLDLATQLDPNLYAVTVACAPDGPLVDRLVEQGVSVLPIPSFRRDISITRDRKALHEVREAIASVRANLIHCHSSKAGVLGRLAAKLERIPSVYTAHGFAFGGEASSLMSRAAFLAIEWWAGRLWTNRIITVSEADTRLALAWKIATRDRVSTVHNGVDLSLLSRIPLPDPSGRTPVIGVISRLVAGKGLEDLLEAAAMLLRRGTYRFLLAGEGPLRPELEMRARNLGITEYVQFPGFVDPVSTLPTIDVFALPSYKEGLPYNVLEAMAAGRPVVATLVGGLPEIITDGRDGRLVPVGSVEALATALEEVVSQPGFAAMAAQARRTIQERFDRNRMIGQIDLIYRGVLAVQ